MRKMIWGWNKGDTGVLCWSARNGTDANEAKMRLQMQVPHLPCQQAGILKQWVLLVQSKHKVGTPNEQVAWRSGLRGKFSQ